LPQRCIAALALPERAQHPVASDVAARRQPLLPAAPPVAAAAYLARRPGAGRLHLPRLAHLQARRATGPVTQYRATGFKASLCDRTAKLKLKIKLNCHHLNTSGTFGLTVSFDSPFGTDLPIETNTSSLTRL